MKILTDNLKKVSGGMGSDDKTTAQEGYLKTTLQIPPHDQVQTLDVYLELQNPRK